MCVQKSKYVTFSSAFSSRYAKKRTSNFRKVVRQHTEGVVGSITCFVGNLLGFPAVKEFWKSVKNWQSYRHEFGLLLFWDTVYKLLFSTTGKACNATVGRLWAGDAFTHTQQASNAGLIPTLSTITDSPESRSSIILISRREQFILSVAA